MRSLAFLLVWVALTAPSMTHAGPAVTLNGVNISGVVNQRFENVNVIIDAKGNLEIQAKGYAARVAGAPPPATASGSPAAASTTGPAPAAAPRPPSAPTTPPAGASSLAVGASAAASGATPASPSRLTRRYFLATEQSQPDGTQYDVEVFINASWIRVVKSSDPQVVTEVTRYLRPGSNKVTLSCTKRLQGVDRRNYGAEVTLKVVVGAGNVGGDHVMIDEPLAVMTRTAAEVDDKVEEFVFEAR
jgi:hypothetical protein